MPAPAQPLRQVLRFHLRVGVRVALSVLVTATAVTAGILAFLRPDFIHSLAQLLFGERSLVSALLVFGAAIAVASVAAPRIAAGLGGWLRHLPVAGATHRRAATAAVAVAETPLLAILAFLALMARSRSLAVTAAQLAGLLPVALAAAQLSLPLRRRAAVLAPALAAGLLGSLGSWPAVAAALALVAAGDLAAGPVRPPRPTRLLRPLGARRSPTALAARAAPFSAPGRASWAVPARIAWRALGWRGGRAYGLSLLPWFAAGLFLSNNHLSPLHAQRAVLLASGVSCVVLLGQLAQALAARRPAWPWVRSLPWSARLRVLADAALLGAHCLPLLALAAVAAPAAALPLAALLPLLATRAAGAVRRPAESRAGAMAEVLLEGLPLAGLAALLPWTTLALLAALPWAVHAAAARERRQKVGLWLERHHLAAGDPHSWSGG
jgi:hypothetical protein